MASNYKLNDNNVNFYVKPEVTFSIGNKIVYSTYDVNNHGDITWHKPVINAIDIDWQNAVTDEITDAINTSGKLISIISNNKKSIRLTNEAITSIREQISNIEEALETIEIGDNTPILNELRESLNSLTERVTAIEEGNVDVDLTEIQNAITEVNNRINNLSIPQYVDELIDGYDVLRRSQFEIIKNQLKGDSAYEIAKKLAEENGTPFPYNNEAEWLESLKGEDGLPGENGLSAFEIARRTAIILNKDFPYANEVEWMTAIMSNDTSYVDQKIEEVNNSMNEMNNSLTVKIQNAITNVLGEGNINESFDTIKEISDWITNHPNSTQIVNDVNDLKEKFKKLLGNVTTVEEDPETHELVEKIKQYSSGSLSGTNWATSIEEVNTILENVSFAQGVQDNAEANKIDSLDFEYQNVVSLTGDSHDTAVQFGAQVLNEQTKNLKVSLNTSLFEKIKQNILNLATTDAETKDTAILEASKEYTNEKLKWIIE